MACPSCSFKPKLEVGFVVKGMYLEFTGPGFKSCTSLVTLHLADDVAKKQTALLMLGEDSRL